MSKQGTDNTLPASPHGMPLLPPPSPTPVPPPPDPPSLTHPHLLILVTLDLSLSHFLDGIKHLAHQLLLDRLQAAVGLLWQHCRGRGQVEGGLAGEGRGEECSVKLPLARTVSHIEGQAVRVSRTSGHGFQLNNAPPVAAHTKRACHPPPPTHTQAIP